jgi:hypothetical protein
MDIDQVLVVKRPIARQFNSAQASFQESLLKIPGIMVIHFQQFPREREQLGERVGFHEGQENWITSFPGRCGSRFLQFSMFRSLPAGNFSAMKITGQEVPSSYT